MDTAFSFSIKSKNGVFCMLCDYEFHKAYAEDKKIYFSYDFCDAMVKETFDFTQIYHLELVDYFNNLL